MHSQQIMGIMFFQIKFHSAICTVTTDPCISPYQQHCNNNKHHLLLERSTYKDLMTLLYIHLMDQFEICPARFQQRQKTAEKKKRQNKIKRQNVSTEHLQKKFCLPSVSCISMVSIRIFPGIPANLLQELTTGKSMSAC